MQIEASLQGPANPSVEVVAVPLPPANGHVLGPLGPQIISFGANGLSGAVRFRLTNGASRLTDVGAHQVGWRWLWRTATTGPWRQFAETSHQIFTVLSTPTEPWVQQPLVRGNTQLPWAEVLEWACGWAARTSDRAAAATRITLAVFTLGGERIRYSCSSGAPSNYSSIGFDCTAFLERLSGGFGRGPAVNCSDCATIVSTFANAVGCDLWQSRMFNEIVPFEVNPIRLIGQATFGPVCGTGLFK